jgi:hypothetical protein
MTIFLAILKIFVAIVSWYCNDLVYGCEQCILLQQILAVVIFYNVVARSCDIILQKLCRCIK